MTARRWLFAILLALPVLFGIAEDAQAVVGRPLTPVSYAGVARRSARRTYARQDYWNSGYAAPATVAAASTVPVGTVAATVPAGCTTVATGGTAVRQCGNTTYSPAYDGGNVVYVSH